MEGIFVNGPINVARVEGTIYGIKKVLYLFMDYHNNVLYQSQCDNFDNIDLNKYMIKEFREANGKTPEKVFDLFLEISNTRAHENMVQMYKARYIDEVQRFFSHETLSEKKAIPNVRYHYIDIRDFLKTSINDISHNLYHAVKNSSVNDSMTQSDYEYILASLQQLSDSVHMTYDLLYPNKQNNQKRQSANKNNKILSNNNEQNYEIVKQFMNKIMTKYNHNELPRKFTELFDIIKNNFDEIFKLIDQMRESLIVNKPLLSFHPEFLNKISSDKKYYYSYGKDVIRYIEFISQLEILESKLSLLIVMTFAMVVDLFFLRRFLDKDYVQNAVVYTGIAHSITYIYMLVKHFDFKITNVSYLADRNTPESATAFIKKSKIGDPEIDKLFYPPSLYQCSNMSDFPTNFN